MGNLTVWLLALVWPLAKKVLTMLGIGWLTYEGVTVALNGAISAAQASWGQVSGSILQISSLGGVPEVMGIISGALIARVSLAVVARLGKITT